MKTLAKPQKIELMRQNSGQTMKGFFLIGVVLAWLPAKAATYDDPTGDFTGGAGFLDMTSVQVDNNASTISFIINLAADPSAPANNWGNHLIGFDTSPAHHQRPGRVRC